MSLLARALQGVERRTTLANPSWDLAEALNPNVSYSGRAVNVDTSLALIPVWSAVRRKAAAVGSLPLVVYRRLDNGREKASNHWMWPLLHDQPNPSMSAAELWQIVAAHIDLWGNSFLAKFRGPMGTMMGGELWPLRPDRVKVGVKDGVRSFQLDGKPERFDEMDILHIRGFSTDGVVGLSPIQQARQGLGVIADMEEFTGRFYGQGAVNSVVLKHPNRLSPEAVENLRTSVKARLGARGGVQPFVLEENMDISTLSMPLEDAQYIETQRFNNLQVALLIGVPPKWLGASTGDSLTYTSSEWESLDFVRWSLTGMLTQIEGALLRDPSMFVQGRRFYPEFLIDALLRGTTKERYDAYAVAIDKGWMDTDEVRELENLPPRDLLPDPLVTVDPTTASRELERQTQDEQLSLMGDIVGELGEQRQAIRELVSRPPRAPDVNVNVAVEDGAFRSETPVAIQASVDEQAARAVAREVVAALPEPAAPVVNFEVPPPPPPRRVRRTVVRDEVTGQIVGIDEETVED